MKKVVRALAWIVFSCCYIFILFRMQSPPVWISNAKGTVAQQSLWMPQEQQVQDQQQNKHIGTASTLALDDNLKVHDDDDGRPPLSALMALISNDSNKHNITNDDDTQHQHHVAEYLASLLDFAVLGSPKTSTSFHIQWLASHPEIQASTEEITALRKGNPAALVQILYNELAAGKQYKRGYKSPHDIESPKALELIARYWPETRLIVGLRHPVLWFQSFYNYRERNGYKMPPAEWMARGCVPDSHSVCITGAEFHVHLSNLGKTNYQNNPREAHLLQSMSNNNSNNKSNTDLVSNKKPQLLLSKSKVFLYTLEQLYDTNETRMDQYRRDLSTFLGLKQNLAPIYEFRSNSSSSTSKEKVSVFDICSQNPHKYDELRQNLMQIARSASVWIREYFLHCQDVYVSSPDYFNQLLLDWMNDPCDKKEMT